MTQPLPGDESIGQNKPCPCGSGKKYKRCHGKVDKPKMAPIRIAAEPGARSQAMAAQMNQQMKAAGMDPGAVDPAALMNMQKVLARMPKGQIQKMQALMQKAMAGKDVTKEAQELEKSMPPELLQQLQAMTGAMGGMPGMPGMPGAEEAIEAEAEEVTPDMSAEEARRIVEKAVAEGKLNREQAEQLLGASAGAAGAEGEGEESGTAQAEESKKGFWKKLTRR